MKQLKIVTLTFILFFGCTISHAITGTVISEDQARKLTYLDPLQFIDDLTTTKTFAKLTFEKNSFTLSSLPINTAHTNLKNKWLIIYTLNNAPKKWPLNFKNETNLGSIKSESDLTIDKYHFHKVLTFDAAMCHQNDYEYYFLKQKNNYLVFEFVLAATCVGVDDTKTVAYDYANETKPFPHSISDFLQSRSLPPK